MSLAKIWSRFFDERKRRPREPAPCLRVMQYGLHALVRRNGAVQFARGGRRSWENPWRSKREVVELTFIVTYLSGTTERLTTQGYPQASISDLLPSVILLKNYVVQVADLEVSIAGPHALLNLCFEDLADDSLTLGTKVLAKPQDANSERQRTEDENAHLEELLDVDDLFHHLLRAYTKEISAPIEVASEELTTAVPFLVSDVMVKPIILYMRMTRDAPCEFSPEARTGEWTLVKLACPLRDLSSNSPVSWRTLEVRFKEEHIVCIKSKGHDSNSESFDMKMVGEEAYVPTLTSLSFIPRRVHGAIDVTNLGAEAF